MYYTTSATSTAATTIAGSNIIVIDRGANFIESVHTGQTPTGTRVTVKTTQGIHPQLYFKYVKSKLSKVEKEKLQARMLKLRRMVLAAKELHQHALHENLARMLVVSARESEALACGIDSFTGREVVNKFIHQIREKVVRFEPFDKFPRIPPTRIRKRIKEVQDKKLFDEYWVAYVDYTGESLKTNKEKIKTKDPILFGCYSYAPDRLYFICDWIDEICDLTLDEMVEKIREEDPDYELDRIAPMDDKYLEALKKQVMAQHDRLTNTNSANFRKHMAKEDADRTGKNWLRKIFVYFSLPPVRFW